MAGEFDNILDPEDPQSFSRGFKSGTAPLFKEVAGEAISQFGKSYGLPDVANYGTNLSAQGTADRAKYRPLVGRVEDINNVSDAYEFAKYQIGQNIPQIAAFLAGRGAGGFASKYAGISKSAGQFAGAAGVGLPIHFAEVSKELREAGHDDAPVGERLTVAAARAALDVVPIEVALGRFGAARKALGSGLGRGVREVAKGAAISGLSEAGTEVAQEALSNIYQNYLDPTFDISGPEAQSEYLNAAVAALIVGGVFGGATSTIGALAPRQEQEPAPVPDTGPQTSIADIIATTEGVIEQQDIARAERDLFSTIEDATARAESDAVTAREQRAVDRRNEFLKNVQGPPVSANIEEFTGPPTEVEQAARAKRRRGGYSNFTPGVRPSFVATVSRNNEQILQEAQDRFVADAKDILERQALEVDREIEARDFTLSQESVGVDQQIFSDLVDLGPGVEQVQYDFDSEGNILADNQPILIQEEGKESSRVRTAQLNSAGILVDNNGQALSPSEQQQVARQLASVPDRPVRTNIASPTGIPDSELQGELDLLYETPQETAQRIYDERSIAQDLEYDKNIDGLSKARTSLLKRTSAQARRKARRQLRGNRDKVKTKYRERQKAIADKQLSLKSRTIEQETGINKLVTMFKDIVAGTALTKDGVIPYNASKRLIAIWRRVNQLSAITKGVIDLARAPARKDPADYATQSALDHLENKFPPAQKFFMELGDNAEKRLMDILESPDLVERLVSKTYGKETNTISSKYLNEIYDIVKYSDDFMRQVATYVPNHESLRKRGWDKSQKAKILLSGLFYQIKDSDVRNDLVDDINKTAHRELSDILNNPTALVDGEVFAPWYLHLQKEATANLKNYVVSEGQTFEGLDEFIKQTDNILDDVDPETNKPNDKYHSNYQRATVKFYQHIGYDPIEFFNPNDKDFNNNSGFSLSERSGSNADVEAVLTPTAIKKLETILNNARAAAKEAGVELVFNPEATAALELIADRDVAKEKSKVWSNDAIKKIDDLLLRNSNYKSIRDKIQRNNGDYLKIARSLVHDSTGSLEDITSHDDIVEYYTEQVTDIIRRNAQVLEEGVLPWGAARDLHEIVSKIPEIASTFEGIAVKESKQFKSTMTRVLRQLYNAAKEGTLNQIMDNVAVYGARLRNIDISYPSDLSYVSSAIKEKELALTPIPVYQRIYGNPLDITLGDMTDILHPKAVQGYILPKVIQDYLSERSKIEKANKTFVARRNKVDRLRKKLKALIDNSESIKWTRHLDGSWTATVPTREEVFSTAQERKKLEGQFNQAVKLLQEASRDPNVYLYNEIISQPDEILYDIIRFSANISTQEQLDTTVSNALSSTDDIDSSAFSYFYWDLPTLRQRADEARIELRTRQSVPDIEYQVQMFKYGDFVKLRERAESLKEGEMFTDIIARSRDVLESYINVAELYEGKRQHIGLTGETISDELVRHLQARAELAKAELATRSIYPELESKAAVYEEKYTAELAESTKKTRKTPRNPLNKLGKRKLQEIIDSYKRLSKSADINPDTLESARVSANLARKALKQKSVSGLTDAFESISPAEYSSAWKSYIKAYTESTELKALLEEVEQQWADVTKTRGENLRRIRKQLKEVNQPTQEELSDLLKTSKDPTVVLEAGARYYPEYTALQRQLAYYKPTKGDVVAAYKAQEKADRIVPESSRGFAPGTQEYNELLKQPLSLEEREARTIASDNVDLVSGSYAGQIYLRLQDVRRRYELNKDINRNKVNRAENRLRDIETRAKAQEIIDDVAQEAHSKTHNSWATVNEELGTDPETLAAQIPAINNIVQQIQTILGRNRVRVIAARSVINSSGRQIAGSFDPVNSIIMVAMNAADTMSAAVHEAYHAAHTSILKPSENATVRRAFKKGAPMRKVLEDIIRREDPEAADTIIEHMDEADFEAEAYAFQYWVRGDLRAQGTLSNIWRKIRQFFERVSNLLSGNGFESYVDVFNALQAGKMANRKSRLSGETEYDSLNISADRVLSGVAVAPDNSFASRASATSGTNATSEVDPELINTMNDINDGMARSMHKLGITRENAGYAGKAVGNWLSDAYHKTLASTSMLARRSPGIAKVFRTLNEMYGERDNWMSINDALLQRVNEYTQDSKKAYNLSNAILVGTTDGVVWDDATLRNRFKLDNKGVAIYRDIRESVDNILDREFEAVIANRERVMGEAADRAESQEEADASFKAFERFATEMRAMRDKLKREGYFPKQRFGNRRIVVVHKTNPESEGTLLASYHVEGDLEAAQMEKFIKTQFKDVAGIKVRKERMSQRIYSQDFVDVSNLFNMIDNTGISISPELRLQLLRKMTDNAVALRKFKRKDITGEDRNITRGLANYISSASSGIASNMHGYKLSRILHDSGTHNWETDEFNSEMGGFYRDRAVSLIEFVRNGGFSEDETVDVAGKLRAAAAVTFLGGNISHGVIQLSQLAMATAPYLINYTTAGTTYSSIIGALKDTASFNPGRGGKFHADNIIEAANNKRKIGNLSVEETQALAEVVEDGTVAAQQIYAIMGMARNSFMSRHPKLRKYIDLWMSPFVLSEEMNRRATFIAAYRIAKQQGISAENKLKSQTFNEGQNTLEFDNAIDFARHVVQETQFIYNRANRPAWARHPVGALLFTFKTYPVFMTELIASLPPKGQATMLATLFLASGWSGLFFMDDLEDLFETFGQMFGIQSGVNVRRTITEMLDSAGDAIGVEDLPDIFMYGMLDYVMQNTPGLGGGFSLGSRLGLGDIIPGSAMFQRSSTLSQEVENIGGPAIAVATGFYKAGGELLRGNIEQALVQQPVSGIRNAAQSFEWYRQNFTAVDKRYYKVSPVSWQQLLAKGIGFSPIQINREYEKSRAISTQKSYIMSVRDDFMRDMIRARNTGDNAEFRRVRDAVNEWNKSHPEPEFRIVIRGQDIARALKRSRQGVYDRALESLPKHQRQGFILDDE